MCKTEGLYIPEKIDTQKCLNIFIYHIDCIIFIIIIGEVVTFYCECLIQP